MALQHEGGERVRWGGGVREWGEGVSEGMARGGVRWVRGGVGVRGLVKCWGDEFGVRGGARWVGRIYIVHSCLE